MILGHLSHAWWREQCEDQTQATLCSLQFCSNEVVFMSKDRCADIDTRWGATGE